VFKIDQIAVLFYHQIVYNYSFTKLQSLFDWGLLLFSYIWHGIPFFWCSILQTLLVTKSWFCLFLLSTSLMVDHMLETSSLCRYDFRHLFLSVWEMKQDIFLIFMTYYEYAGVYGSSRGSFLFQGSHEDGRRSISQFEG